jgi:hypothetical protein
LETEKLGRHGKITNFWVSTYIFLVETYHLRIPGRKPQNLAIAQTCHNSPIEKGQFKNITPSPYASYSNC